MRVFANYVPLKDLLEFVSGRCRGRVVEQVEEIPIFLVEEDHAATEQMGDPVVTKTKTVGYKYIIV